MATLKRKQLYDIESGKQFVPITHTQAVFDDNGKTVEDRISDIETDLDVINEINSVTKNVIDSTAGFYFADNDGNVAVEISDEGVFDCAAVGNNLKALINENADELPSFLQTEYDTTITSLVAHALPAIVFATDLHTRPLNSPLTTDVISPIKRLFTAMRMISKQFPVRLSVLGGDYIQPNGEESNLRLGIDCIMDVHRMFSGVDSHRMAIAGNHERTYSGTSGGTGLTLAQQEGYIHSKYTNDEIRRVARFTTDYSHTYATETDASKKHDDGKLVYYYIDHEQQICFVFYSFSFSGDDDNNYYAHMMREVWAANTDDYPYVFFNHFSINASDNYAPWPGATQVIDYFQTNGHTNIIAWIGGHSHFDDCTAYVNGNNTPVIVISCIQAGLMTSMPNRNNVTQDHTADSATESAMSFFQFDQANKIIYQTQYGLGSDHVYVYGTTPTRDGQTINNS